MSRKQVMKIKTFISLLLLVASCVLLLMTQFSTSVKEESGEVSPTSNYQFLSQGGDSLQGINSSELINTFDDTQEFDGLMLFVIESKFCSTCVNEISEYLNESETYINSSLNDLKIKSHTFVLGRDSTDLKAVKRIMDIPYSVSLLSPQSELYMDLSSIKSGHAGLNKILFIDTNERRVASIIRIFNYSTEVHVKRNLIRDALSSIKP